MVLMPALLLGVLNPWVVHRIGYEVYQHSKRYSESAQTWWARGMFLGLGLWLIVSMFLGEGIGWVVFRVTGE